MVRILVTSLVLLLASPRARAEVTGPIKARLTALVDGVVRGGPAHTVHGIRRRPGLFVTSLAAVGAAGAVSAQADVDTEYAVMGGSGAILVLQLRRSRESIRLVKGPERWRVVGAEVVWPSLLWGTTTAGGLLLGEQASMTPTRAAAQSILLGGDGPSILVMALDPAKRKQP